MSTIHPVLDVHDGVFNTATGKLIDIKNPTIEMIDIEDIATGLSNYCRFGGQIKQNYNVAQHSVLVAYLAPMDLMKVALLHDATEAYLGDVIKPLKVILGAPYEELETKWTKVIFEKFGLNIDLLPEIKVFDNFLLQAESDYLRTDDNHVLIDLMREYGEKEIVWSHEFARAEFLKVFHQIF